jgi:hypothetical protein
MRHVVALGLLTAILASCASRSLDWENYPPAVKRRIDQLAAKGNCEALLEESDWADEHNDEQRDAFGDDNAALIAYINDKLEDAGCRGAS